MSNSAITPELEQRLDEIGALCRIADGGLWWHKINTEYVPFLLSELREALAEKEKLRKELAEMPDWIYSDHFYSYKNRHCGCINDSQEHQPGCVETTAPAEA